MRALVACEFSGHVRDAFRDKGHDAWSCDLLGSLSRYHIQYDVTKILGDNWDLLIAHPPCTALCVSGNGTYAPGKDKYHERLAAIEFFKIFLDAPVEKICVENPVGVISTALLRPSQYVQPYQFGHPESKRTGLWLKNLPLLQATNVLDKPSCGYWENQTPSGQNKIGPSPDRGLLRSITYSGIAKAMAEQWG